MTPAVTISAVFRAGSVSEPPDLPGLAYLMGRVIDRGTERRSAAVIAQDLDDRGVSLRVSTNRHGLTLSSTCLAEDFDEVLDIILDIARSPIFPDDEVRKRRADAITAIRQDEDNPGVRAVEGLWPDSYGRIIRWPVAEGDPTASLEPSAVQNGSVSTANGAALALRWRSSAKMFGRARHRPKSGLGKGGHADPVRRWKSASSTNLPAAPRRSIR